MAIIDNLVSYYKLDESSGNAIDAHGSNDGTVTGATQGATGKINTAYSFDGSNDYITSALISTVTDNFSMSAWIYITGDILDCFFSNGREGGVFNGYSFQISNAGGGGAGKMLGVSLNGVIFQSTSVNIAINQWVHVAYTRTSGTAEFYIDGTAHTPNSPTSTPNTPASTETIIGARDTGVGTWDRFFDGKVDEIGFWERALTSDEVTQLYNSGDGLAYRNFTYKQERSAGNLKLGKGLFGKSRSKLFTKSTASGEIKVKTSTGSTQKIIDINTSYNSSSTEIETTTTAWGNMLTKTHKSNTGKVMVIANAPLIYTGLTGGGDVDLRLTKSGTLIDGSIMWGLWNTGDGALSASLMGFVEVDIDKTYTYALQWREGEAEEPFIAGFSNTGSSYNILIQDII